MAGRHTLTRVLVGQENCFAKRFGVKDGLETWNKFSVGFLHKVWATA